MPVQNPPEHPNLSLLVTDTQRERVVSYLQEAYADGRLTEIELDTRVGQALTARTRRELNASLANLVQVPISSSAVSVRPSYAPLRNVYPAATNQRQGVAALAHWSGLASGVVGPVIFYAVSPQGSYVRREAAKAFNFQLLSMIAGMIFGVATVPMNNGGGYGFLVVLWIVLTVAGGMKALHGKDWTNPVNRIVPFNVLSDGRPAPRQRSLRR